MGKPFGITGDWTASGLRQLAASSKHANQIRRLLSLAAVLEGTYASGEGRLVLRRPMMPFC